MSETTKTYNELQANKIPDTKKIASLANRPNKQGPNGKGYTADELKAYFDLASSFLQDYINTALLSNGAYIKIADNYTNANGNNPGPASLAKLVESITSGYLATYLIVGADDLCLKDAYLGMKERDVASITKTQDDDGINLTLERYKDSANSMTDKSETIALENPSVHIPFSDFKTYIEEIARADFKDNANLSCAYDNTTGKLTVSLKHGEEIVYSSVVNLPLESVITNIEDYTDEKTGIRYLKLSIKNGEPIYVEYSEIFDGYARENNVYSKQESDNKFISRITGEDDIVVEEIFREINGITVKEYIVRPRLSISELYGRIESLENGIGDVEDVLHKINEGGVL